MRKALVVFALGTLAFAGQAFADKPEVKPYAAAAPNGGIPLWNPGEKFIGIAGGSCRGTCPIYELYLFDDGRVVFQGRKDTSKTGVWKKQVGPDVYAELLTMIVRTQVLDKAIKRRACLKGRSMLTVMRSASDSGDARRVSLNSGCEGHADIAREIEGRFIESTGVAGWLVSP